MLKTETYFSILLVLMLLLVIETTKCRARARLRARRFVTVLSQLHSEIDRRDHAVRTCNSFAGNFKRGAVIGTGARKRKPKRRVHTLVKGVEFQRNQSLIVIHAKYRIEFAFDRTMKNCVGRVGACENGM